MKKKSLKDLNYRRKKKNHLVGGNGRPKFRTLKAYTQGHEEDCYSYDRTISLRPLPIRTGQRRVVAVRTYSGREYAEMILIYRESARNVTRAFAMYRVHYGVESSSHNARRDGATPHSIVEVQTWLNDMFVNKWIGRYGPRRWPTRSPD
ncbi:hypothetical protein EVAR_55989_1 [Eumeta japonica]|uniref:DUF4817 domain-containing protein n=1 Tax=Eumeta variegata TaxID=151549 RepID=A0A4C1Y8H8_EUMVA|nr:hypothetical protein EVAR_55989_1 [Eumeta japonica]